MVGYFGGVVLGSFSEKTRKGVFLGISNSNQYPRKGYIFSPPPEIVGSGDGERAYRYPLILWGCGGGGAENFNCNDCSMDLPVNSFSNAYHDNTHIRSYCQF